MALHAPVKSSSDFTPAPAGPQPAVCCDVVDLGIQETQWGDKHKLWIVWLLSEIEPESGKPFIVVKRYTLSMHEKSNLYSDICSWRGVRMAPAEAEAFDLESLIGKTCLLNIVHTTKETGIYANVNTIMALPNGYHAPQIGDYKRHLHRSADENPRDVRNPHVGKNEKFQPNGHETPKPNGNNGQKAQQPQGPDPILLKMANNLQRAQDESMDKLAAGIEYYHKYIDDLPEELRQEAEKIIRSFEVGLELATTPDDDLPF